MKTHCRLLRLGLLSAFSMLLVVASSVPSFATGNIVKSDLKGTWQIALRGNTGCGFSSMLAVMTLNTSGTGTGTLETHGECGNSSLSGQTFTINSLTTKGTGTAGLTCGTSCGWTFNIQVSPDRTKFNLTDISPSNPGNYLEGVAVLSSPAGNIVTPDLTGAWQVTLLGQGGCGIGTSFVSFTLNSSGLANNAASVNHSSGCGDNISSGNTFQILSLNPDGSGTAGLSCGSGCGFAFNIQVSPDRSTFNLVDVSASNPGNFLAGGAIRASSAGDVVKANLSGPWQVALYGQGGCGNGSTLVTFTMNAKATSTNATETAHTSGCGDSMSTGNTFTVTSLNADGSGTAGLSCGPSCGFTFNLQVSPDRSTFSLVDVSPANPGNYLIGKAIHQ